jgi:23S rRNA (pseudouridine1915-N3)-methyltransferase
MTKFRLLTVGRPHAGCLSDLTKEYLRRMGPPWQVTWEWVREEAGGSAPVSRILTQTGDRVRARLAAREFVIVLDEQGEELSSLELASHLRSWRELARPVSFVVGSHYGLDETLRQRADWRWSLSRLTWPHEFVPLLVAEHLYRAWTIVVRHPYHRA